MTRKLLQYTRSTHLRRLLWTGFPWTYCILVSNGHKTSYMDWCTHRRICWRIYTNVVGCSHVVHVGHYWHHCRWTSRYISGSKNCQLVTKNARGSVFFAWYITSLPASTRDVVPNEYALWQDVLPSCVSVMISFEPMLFLP